MVELLKETSTLREPILKIQSTVEETKAGVKEIKMGVEETKFTVKNIFESIEGQSIRGICIYVSYSDLHT